MFHTLTGRRRYRSTAHGLILQVEWVFWDFDDMRWRCEFMDAAPRDVNKFELA